MSQKKENHTMQMKRIILCGSRGWVPSQNHRITESQNHRITEW